MNAISGNMPQVASLSESDTKRLREATADFEALFVRQLFSAMRKAVPEGEEGLFAKSNGEKIFREMLDGEYANIISRRPNGLGMKESIFKEMTRNYKLPTQETRGALDEAQAKVAAMKAMDHRMKGSLTPSSE
ncbi:MAG: rod-binding protein [Magnetococcales bacterium]|nr:rod-binding protein [Magnetococcales bacterium]